MCSCRRIGRHSITAGQRISSRNDDTGLDQNSSSLASADRQFNLEGTILELNLGKTYWKQKPSSDPTPFLSSELTRGASESLRRDQSIAPRFLKIIAHGCDTLSWRVWTSSFSIYI